MKQIMLLTATFLLMVALIITGCASDAKKASPAAGTANDDAPLTVSSDGHHVISLP